MSSSSSQLEMEGGEENPHFLPKEMELNIIKYLPRNEIVRICNSTSKDLKNTCKKEGKSFWHELVVRDKPILNLSSLEEYNRVYFQNFTNWYDLYKWNNPHDKLICSISDNISAYLTKDGSIEIREVRENEESLVKSTIFHPQNKKFIKLDILFEFLPVPDNETYSLIALSNDGSIYEIDMNNTRILNQIIPQKGTYFVNLCYGGSDTIYALNDRNELFSYIPHRIYIEGLELQRRGEITLTTEEKLYNRIQLEENIVSIAYQSNESFERLFLLTDRGSLTTIHREFNGDIEDEIHVDKNVNLFHRRLRNENPKVYDKIYSLFFDGNIITYFVSENKIYSYGNDYDMSSDPLEFSVLLNIGNNKIIYWFEGLDYHIALTNKRIIIKNSMKDDIQEIDQLKNFIVTQCVVFNFTLYCISPDYDLLTIDLNYEEK